LIFRVARISTRPHVLKMSTYTIVESPDQSGYEVQIEGTDGVRQSVLGFDTQELAQAWIRQDQALNRAADPFSW
jgi:hypothetical protein